MHFEKTSLCLCVSVADCVSAGDQKIVLIEACANSITLAGSTPR
jgi:hypothetical protein